MVAISRDLFEEDFQVFVNLAMRFAGIRLDSSKKQMIIGRLIRRARTLKLTSLSMYREYLENHIHDEQAHFVSAITTNLTAFFREAHHFEYLTNWLREHRSAGRIWCSACSTGQEPYSIAIAAAEADALQRCRIVATDIDREVVAKAQAGVYRNEDIDDLSIARKRRFFLKGDGANSGYVKVKEELGSRIDFGTLNLLQDWPQQTFDVIFCRNVFIYFDEPTQSRIIRRFHEHMEPDGILFIGHSESPTALDGLFESIGRTTYRRV